MHDLGIQHSTNSTVYIWVIPIRFIKYKKHISNEEKIEHVHLVVTTVRSLNQIRKENIHKAKIATLYSL